MTFSYGVCGRKGGFGDDEDTIKKRRSTNLLFAVGYKRIVVVFL